MDQDISQQESIYLLTLSTPLWYGLVQKLGQYAIYTTFPHLLNGYWASNLYQVSLVLQIQIAAHVQFSKPCLYTPINCNVLNFFSFEPSNAIDV